MGPIDISSVSNDRRALRNARSARPPIDKNMRRVAVMIGSHETFGQFIVNVPARNATIVAATA